MSEAWKWLEEIESRAHKCFYFEGSFCEICTRTYEGVEVSILNKWEAEASGGYGQIVKDTRILTLIKALRLQEDALGYYVRVSPIDDFNAHLSYSYKAKKVIADVEKLLKGET